MYEIDIDLLSCPETMEELRILSVEQRADDGEIIEGTIGTDSRTYRITNGIPRFVGDTEYNKSWDFKWTHFDKGVGYNYRIIDRNDKAYAIHDIYDRNSHEGKAFRHMKGRLVLDVGCGIGQYAVKSLIESGARKIVALDLTHGVDIFRKIVLERYGDHAKDILIVQGNVFSMPFREEKFDYVYSLGVLMHTGNTLRALNEVCKRVKPFGEINVWIYCSEPCAYDAVEDGRGNVLSLANFHKFKNKLRFAMFWIHLFRKISHEKTLKIIKFFTSDYIFNLSRKRGFRWISSLFPSVDYDEYGYRLINHYDGYVNNWCDTWSEHEIFPTLQANSIAVLGISTWRLGVWGRKVPNFYTAADSPHGPAERGHTA
ncbi:class I SAM-dependent methyltransferase [Oleispirillum naphthae]|uniref:class I SAM-dependent methyltransferase n=1 Tax=Oleispirillum naphthae TaxID=2838853 RepID=UPI00308244A4